MTRPCCRHCGGNLVDGVAPKSGRKLRYCPKCHSKAKRLAKSVRPDRAVAQLRAHKAISRAIRLGHLQRKPCDVCGQAPAEGHHDDYSKPLEVVWLCRSHHRQRHLELSAAGKAP